MAIVNFIVNCFGTGLHRAARRIQKLSKAAPGKPIIFTPNGSMSNKTGRINAEYPVIWRLRNALGIESITVREHALSTDIADDLEILRRTFEFPREKKHIMANEMMPKKFARLEVQDLSEVKTRLKALEISANPDILDNETSGTVRFALGARFFGKLYTPVIALKIVLMQAGISNPEIYWGIGIYAAMVAYIGLKFTNAFRMGRGYLASNIQNIIKFCSMR